jgi:hypothetical protein
MKTIVTRWWLAGVVLVVGCSSQVGSDSHTEVFQTAREAAEARKKKLLVEWQELASKIANGERADVKTRKGEGFTLVMSADGVERPVDLSPLTERLSSANGKEGAILREYLAGQWPEFDRERLRAMGFEKVKGRLRPYLMNGKEAGAIPKALVNPVVIDLNWAPMVRWEESGKGSAVDREVVSAWGVSEREVNEAALANLRGEVGKLGALFQTTDLPGLGRYGSLRPGVEASVVLLPEFLSAVRKEWKSADDVVVFMPSRTSISFTERGNRKLLDWMIPEWGKMYAKVEEPLITQRVLVGEGGVVLFSYAPATGPATKAGTTKPTGYIVR